MKRLLCVFLTLLALNAIGQIDSTENETKDTIAALKALTYPLLKGDTLITSTGYKIAKGMEIKMGTGSMPDGDFKYIRRNAASLFAYNSSTGYQGLANQANALTRSASGLSFKVIRIDARGNKKHGYVYYPVMNGGMVRYEIDIENAIKAGEVDVPDAFKVHPATNEVKIIQQTSVADELTKLKKLLDDGVLTQEEFDAQKKKLLEK